VLQILSTNAKAATIAGVAIAATAGGGAVVATTVADSTPTTTVATHDSQGDANEAPDVKDSETPDAHETPDAKDTAKAPAVVTPVDCGTTAWANHGAFVKTFAQASIDPTASPGAHGAAVSAAAQSDCGKPTPGASQSTQGSQGATHRNANATNHQSATHGKSATAHTHHS
jgi:hypothetical protein